MNSCLMILVDTKGDNNMIDGMRIIDGHVHTFETDEIAQKVLKAFNQLYEIEFENRGTGSIRDVLENMSVAGIDYTVMVNFASEKILKKTNDFTLLIAEQNPKLIPFISFHPSLEKENLSLLEAYIQKGAKGIKFHSMAQQFMPTDSRLNTLYEACHTLKFPIVYHCGRVSNKRLNPNADLEHIEPVIKKYPNIPIILTHMVDGNKEDVLRCASTYENVYFDTSIVITGNETMKRVNEPSWVDDAEVAEIIRKVGAHRVLFGSDYPWGSPNCDLKRIMGLHLSRAEQEAILGNNFAKLLALK